MGLMDLAGAGIELALIAAIAALPLFLVVAVVTLAGRKRMAPWFRHALWSLVLIRLALPLSIGSPVSLREAWTRVTGGAELTPTEIFSIPDGRQSAQPADLQLPAPQPVPLAADSILENAGPQPAVPDSNLLDWVWGLTLASLVVGSLALGLWTLITTLRLRQRIRSGTIVADAAALDLLAEGCRAFEIHRPVTMSHLPSWGSPATVGVVHPQILLPEDADHWNEAELRHVVWHELAHVRRFDVVWNSLLTIVRCLQWWNPMFWWAQRCWLAERELACDALVVERIGMEHAADYGRTLLSFIERLGTTRSWGVGSVLPGLVNLLGERATIRRRLRALAAPAPGHSALRRRVGYIVLILVAIVGLTDAAPPTAPVITETSITLPDGAAWRGSTTRSGLATSSSVYDLEAAIERIRQDEPEMSPHVAAECLQRDAASQLRLVQHVHGATDESELAARAVLSEDRHLIVRATDEQHRRIREMLECRSRHGYRQVVVETSWVSTPGEITDLIPGGGGEIISPEYGRLRVAEPVAGDSVRMESFYPVPAYVRVMKPGTIDRERLSRMPEVNHLFSPKITLFEGMSASVNMERQLPFVTGFETGGTGEPVAKVTVCHVGNDMQVTARYDDAGKRATLQIAYRHSEVVDVETLKLRLGSKAEEVAVQIPHLSGSLVELTIPVDDGDTLLVAPLRRDKEGFLRIGLITPRLLRLQPQ